jgi:hypothetical protein
MESSGHTSATMSQTSTLQTAIEAVEALSPEDQDFLFDFLHKRRITERREEIRQNGIAAMESVKNGTAKCGTVDEIMADLLGDNEE